MDRASLRLTLQCRHSAPGLGTVQAAMLQGGQLTSFDSIQEAWLSFQAIMNPVSPMRLDCTFLKITLVWMQKVRSMVVAVMVDKLVEKNDEEMWASKKDGRQGHG
ncbi:hypothetical protein NDU88_001783 [Pleurodeles waltl]|uniref:Uncharacterized protein n=1 Tax=Pleurodeles waltl TaxID=8319 RepID=A0AAV7RA21_PLEWA|nr:hypothetical protein NDU88_001782 [Pleurodeles waltl]KAJ1148959.1 hypothetical protein NDU88_001783 [Pleurodeles waltl]